jgi:hypothetical protein
MTSIFISDEVLSSPDEQITIRVNPIVYTLSVKVHFSVGFEITSNAIFFISWWGIISTILTKTN